MGAEGKSHAGIVYNVGKKGIGSAVLRKREKVMLQEGEDEGESLARPFA